MEIVKSFNFDIEKRIVVVNNTNIPVIGDYDNPWFAGKAMCVALGYKDPKDTLKHLKQKHKLPLQELKKIEGCHQVSYNKGKAVYINKHGLESLLSKSKIATKSGVVEDLIEQFSLNLNLVHRTKEQEFIGAIRTVFAHKNHQTQFAIGRYR